MIKFSKEKVLLLHQIMAEATGSSAKCSEILKWINEHKTN